MERVNPLNDLNKLQKGLLWQDARQRGRMGKIYCKLAETNKLLWIYVSFKTYAHVHPHKLCAYTWTHRHDCGDPGGDAIKLAMALRKNNCSSQGRSFLWETKQNKTKHRTVYKLKPRVLISIYHLNAEDLSSLVGGSKGHVFIYINKMLLRNILFPEHLASWFWKKKVRQLCRVGKRTKTIGVSSMKKCKFLKYTSKNLCIYMIIVLQAVCFLYGYEE